MRTVGPSCPSKGIRDSEGSKNYILRTTDTSFMTSGKFLNLIKSHFLKWGTITPTYQLIKASLIAQLVKNPSAMRETWVRSLSWEDPLEKGKATHSSTLGEFQGLYSPWDLKESDMTGRLSLHFTSLFPKDSSSYVSCIGRQVLYH